MSRPRIATISITRTNLLCGVQVSGQLAEPLHLAVNLVAQIDENSRPSRCT